MFLLIAITLPNTPSSLINKLEKRKGENLYRSLSKESGLVDFVSNDYLGFVTTDKLLAWLDKQDVPMIPHYTGSTGSRLLSGNTEYAEALESKIANFHGAEAGLLFNSGYDANLGLFSSIAGKDDTIIYDELIHASIKDGARLGLAKHFSFRHNDAEHLRQKIKAATGNIFVAVESVYSMDGDFAPLEELAEICEEEGANLIVDEAHATGIYGAKGEGIVSDLKLQNQVFARMHTFGKAVGCHGAIVLGSKELRDYLINFARSFIYTTALPGHSLLAIDGAYQLLPESEAERKQLVSNINYYTKNIIALVDKVNHKPLFDINDGFNLLPSPIQTIIIPGNENVRKAAQIIRQKGFDVRPVLSPTVPAGKERLRICLHSFNTEMEMEGLLGYF